MGLPITILGGYLGSGKTTLVNHLLRNANGVRLAILVNEFGELPIDADLIEAEDDDIISLSGGCVCCSYGNDLMMALMEMAKMDPSPDHIILEASGVALPGAIENSVSLLDGYRVDGIVVLADAETVKARSKDKYMSDTITRQLEDADLVVLNKCDLVDEVRLTALKDWLSQDYPEAKLLEAVEAKLPRDVILQSFEMRPKEAGKFHEIEGYSTTWETLERGVDPMEYGQDLIEKRPNLVRAKGFVKDLEGAIKTVQIVGKRLAVSDAPPGVPEGIVIIEVTR